MSTGLGRAFSPEENLSAEDIAKLATDIPDTAENARQVFAQENISRYFDEVDGGYKLNRDGLEALSIVDNRKPTAQIAAASKDEDSFIAQALNYAEANGLADVGVINGIRETGSYENVRKIFSDVVC